jgi:hypothetical protein
MTRQWYEQCVEGTAQHTEMPAEVQKHEKAMDARLVRPTTRDELREWCAKFLKVTLPREPVCPGHNTPLDYLDYVFFERGEQGPLVWANRGGGKTLIAAVASVLDMIFKPGIEIRILGGSATQTERVYEHLVRFVEHGFRDLLIKNGKLGRITKSGFVFGNGSRVELLAQSEGSVRGARVQKVRCDEIDLFDPAIWEAVQLVTRSKKGPNGLVRGSVEGFSTMNSMQGLMQSIVAEKRRRLFTWCAWDVVEHCTDACAGCRLQADCDGKAHRASGFIPVDDLRTMKDRVKRETWRMEVLCDAVAARAEAGKVVMRYY